MQDFNSPNIFYLEPFDFTDNYDIQIRDTHVNPHTDTPLFYGTTIVMVQGNFCGYCTSFKPHFQRAADELRTFNFATIQVDGEYKDFYRANIASIIKAPLKGVPTVIKFYRGRPVSVYSGPLDYNSLKQWILQS